MKEYFRKEHVRPVLRFFTRIVIAVGVILLLDILGLWVLFFFTGQWNLSHFVELIEILLLLEGSLIGAAGGFMYVGYSEYRIGRQHAINPAIVADQRQRWRERRLSQQKWGLAMLIAGFLLILIFLLMGFSIHL